MLRKIYLGFQVLALLSSGAKAHRNALHVWWGWQEKIEVSTGFQKQRGWGMCRSIDFCAYGYGLFLVVSCRWRTQKTAAEEHVLLLKAPNYYYYFNSKPLCSSVSFLYFSNPYLAGKGQVIRLPCFHRCFLTHHYFTVDWNPEEEKREDPFLMLFFREPLLMPLGMVPHILNICIWTKSDVFAHTE